VKLQTSDGVNSVRMMCEGLDLILMDIQLL